VGVSPTFKPVTSPVGPRTKATPPLHPRWLARQHRIDCRDEPRAPHHLRAAGVGGEVGRIAAAVDDAVGAADNVPDGRVATALCQPHRRRVAPRLDDDAPGEAVAAPRPHPCVEQPLEALAHGLGGRQRKDRDALQAQAGGRQAADVGAAAVGVADPPRGGIQQHPRLVGAAPSDHADMLAVAAALGGGPHGRVWHLSLLIIR
jgi:hypothetical protein